MVRLSITWLLLSLHIFRSVLALVLVEELAEEFTRTQTFLLSQFIIKHHYLHDSCTEDTVVFLFVFMSRFDRAVMSRSRSPPPKMWPFHTIYSPTTWLLLRNVL